MLAALFELGCGPAASSGSSRVVGPEDPAPHLRSTVEPDAPGEAPISDEPMPDPASTEDVTLGGILAYADRHSPILVVARSTRARADAARIAASPRAPGNLDVSVALGPRLGRLGTRMDADVSLMQQVQIAGERGVRRTAADRFADLTEADIETNRWAVHTDVHAAFHRALVERERVRLAERVVTFQADVLRVVEQQIEAGETAPLALRLAQAEVAQAEQVQVAAEQSYFAARIELAQLSGWPVSNPPNPTGTVDAPRDPPAVPRLLAVARERLPSLRAGAAAVREAEARNAVANRERWPRPSLGVQYRREGNPSAEGPYNIVLGVLAFSIPSFQRNQGARARTRADISVANAELGARHSLLEGQIVAARSAVVAAARRTRAYGTEIIPKFEENLTLLRRSFELGEIDLLALSVGRERFLRIQSDALAAQLDYFVALAGLERVVGVDLWHDDHHEDE